MNEEIQIIRLTEWEAKDKVLKYLIEQWKEDGKQSKRLFHSEVIRKNVFPDVHLEKIEYLIERIVDFDSKLLNVYDGVGHSRYRVGANSFTSDFVEIHGGFEQINLNEEREKSEAKKRETRDEYIRELELDKLKHEQTIRDQISRIRNLEEQNMLWGLIKHYWWFIGACIGIGIFLGKLLEVVL